MTADAARDEPRCAPESGRVAPVVDRNRCEAKSDCVRVCPYDVFEVRKLTSEERRGLSSAARSSSRIAAGRRSRYAPMRVTPAGCA